MAITSANVNAGDDILATDHNTLRADLLTGHDHDGTEGNSVLTPTQITVTPGGAVVGISIVQANDEAGINIDTSSANHAGIEVYGKYGGYIEQDISSGYGLTVLRNIAEAGSNPLGTFQESNTNSTQPVLRVVNAGVSAPNGAMLIETTNVSATNWCANMFANGNHLNAGGLRIQCGQDNGNANWYIGCYDGDGDQTGNIESDGAGGLQLNSISDETKKMNIRDTSLSLSILMQLKVRDYEMKKSGVTSQGLIAQEVEPIYPLAVSKQNPSNDFIGISYAKFTPLLIKAVQELTKRVEILEN